MVEVIEVDGDIHEHGARQHEVAEFRMDKVAVNAHMAEPGLDRDGLVRDDPRRVARALIHLHREAHGRIDRADAARLERGDDVCPDLVDLVAGPVELEIGNRPRRAAQRLAGHAHHEAEKRPGPGIVAKDFVALRIEAGAGDFDEARRLRRRNRGRVDGAPPHRSPARGGLRNVPRVSGASRSDGLRASCLKPFEAGLGHERS